MHGASEHCFFPRLRKGFEKSVQSQQPCHRDGQGSILLHSRETPCAGAVGQKRRPHRRMTELIPACRSPPFIVATARDVESPTIVVRRDDDERVALVGGEAECAFDGTVQLLQVGPGVLEAVGVAGSVGSLLLDDQKEALGPLLELLQCGLDASREVGYPGQHDPAVHSHINPVRPSAARSSFPRVMQRSSRTDQGR